MGSRILPPGTVFAGYRIERVLGSGGMGTVYVAAHPRLPRRDALKVLAAEFGADPEFRARFVREAELAAQLDHPNIIGVYDRGIERDQLWIAMRFIDGPDAATLSREGALTPPRVAHLITGVARGLDHAHRAGMLHRDVKPANILVEVIPGQPDRVAVTDFGIAKAAAGTTLTQAGTILATVAYAAPEQLTGAAVDKRADVYALGCTLYELLTGAKPFPRASVDAVIAAHLTEPPPRPSAVASLPRAIDEVIARAMAKDPQRRYASCGELASAAAGALGVEPESASLGRPTRRRGLGIALGAVAAVAALAAAGVVVLNRDSSAPGGPGPNSSAAPLDPNSWAAHQWVIDAFPGLLPKTKADSGFQGILCSPVDENQRPIDAGETRYSTHTLACNGNREPVSRLILQCGTDEPVAEFKPSSRATRLIGDEDWQRASGRGHIRWSDTTDVDLPAGELQLSFADGPRAKCALTVTGGTSGQDLFDRWWRDGPL
ncbi:serine/threonine-protein kinase [Nocardia neocaledoniensis]|uniref:serine/threonine-protein kinase n=1 Tax=Nocardia neocaledoniensis TaxID=236511 RepID=UPI002454E95A|nr:serine/threonine-protein kinase [Nocardia neocaledoniensis]